MVKFEQLRFLLSDNESLAQYCEGGFPQCEDVKRRLFLKRRDENRWIPDSLYLLAKEETFRNVNSLAGLLSHALTKMSSEFLDLEGNKIYVKPEQQTKWQELITFIPPLLLLCSFLQDKVSFDRSQLHTIISLFKDVLLPNTKYTAIPSSRIAQLDHFVSSEMGLHDLHMHLNGALETDQVWQDYLFSPNAVYADLTSAFTNSKVKEQLEQESQLFKPNLYVSLLFTAQKLRQFLFDYLFLNKSQLDVINIENKHQLLQKLLDKHSSLRGNFRHPFSDLISKDPKFAYLMTAEALMYMLVIQELSRNENETLAGLFHFYLLILGLTNRLLVQQTHQNGFDQFQKHTLNGLREHSEKVYLKRYFQMHGNQSRNLYFLEGRFSPKSSEKDMIKFIDSILGGWDNMRGELTKYKLDIDPTVFDQPELRLVAHFIKKKERHIDVFIRHKELRIDTWQRAKVLGLLLKKHEKYRKKVVAVDAAASEFDAPPEIFAPSFRLMRRIGIKHFTYHAGEDFYHIPGGLRAIYEAIIFCGLKKGDRIGHCTAAGLPVNQWSKVVGEQILIRKGHYLDDLVFIYHLIVTLRIEALHPIIPFLSNRIQNLSHEIYNDHYALVVLENAWLMRECCPFHILEENKQDVELKRIFNEEEWQHPVKKDFFEKRTDIGGSPVTKVYQEYHSKKIRNEYEKIIQIDPFEVVSPEQVELLQLELLSEMNRREIVIETLPTSNVRIGFHRDYSTYHLKNWIKWEDEGKSIPPIIVGTDDTGIFATNIYNEYANIYCMLVYDHNVPHSKAMTVIKKLSENSKVYKFL